MCFMPFSKPYSKARAHLQMDYVKFGPVMPTMAHLQMDYVKIGPFMLTVAHSSGLWLYSKDLLLVCIILRVSLHTSVLLSLDDN